MNINRRTFLLAGATAAAGVAAIPSEERRLSHLVKGSTSSVEPFHGLVQPGIATAQQEHAQWTAFTFTGTDVASLHRLLRVWSTDAALLMSAKPAMGDAEGELALEPSSLTITFGFGFSLYAKLGRSHKWPFGVNSIPSFAIDELNPELSDGDVVVQVCGNDRVRVHHATRELMRDARAFAQVKWQQTGFLSGSELAAGQTPRNLMGQKDGSANFETSTQAFAHTVFTTSPAGATSMVIRKIRMNLDTWEKLNPQMKEQAIGRTLTTGAPLTGGHEFSAPDYTARSENRFVIPVDAHMRRAHETKSFLHRRGYNYQVETGAGTESGLMFVSFQADPATFIKIQKALAALDSLNKWTTPVGSGLYFIPPGCQEGKWVGEGVM